MTRDYQYGFSGKGKGRAMFDIDVREKKARTMVAVLQECLPESLDHYSVINVGGSAGIIDHYLADHFARVIGVDIDEPAVAHAKATFQRENLEFQVGDALDLQFPDASFDVVVCSQVYEHVPDAAKMMSEIRRVLKPAGICYFAASNRLMWNEPHYNLPLLSVIPRPLAHIYIRLAGRAESYYEHHYSYWGLRYLVREFAVDDFTHRMVVDPERYHVEYMVRPGSMKSVVAGFVARWLCWLSPGYIWILKKTV
ncbi:MAG: class I SAM-dependent methyltransferase [bacterium]|nr:class I SAM-dependent methyltransferase [bacterium]